MRIDFEDVKVFIGEVEEEKKDLGPTPYPDLNDLREWSLTLLKRYKPKYNPVNKSCSFCAFGPCDLSANRKGACGIALNVQTAREALFMATTGAATHLAHARHMLNHLIKKHGKNFQLNVAENTEIHAPLTRLITGINPKTLSDLSRPLEYAEKQITGLLASLHAGQESNDLDFGVKTLHAGLIDLLAMEIADITQVSALNLPKGDANARLVDVGFGVVDDSKPVILCLGHNVSSASEIVDYVKEKKYDVEIVGICCTAQDVARYGGAKIIGPLSYQLPYIRSGIADVVVTDEQCVRTDTIENASKLGIPVITTSDKNIGGFADFSKEESKIVVSKLANGLKGVYVPDFQRAAEIAVETALLTHKNKKSKNEVYTKDAKKCKECGLCVQACPVKSDVRRIIMAINDGILDTFVEDFKKGVDTSKESLIKKMLTEGAYTPTELESTLKVSRQYVYKIIESLKPKKLKFGKEVYYSLSKNALKKRQDDLKAGKRFMVEKPMSKEEFLDSIERCVFCGRCESYCPQKIPMVSIFSEILKTRLLSQKEKMRVGRGAIQDLEIREVGRPIVFGEVPGIIAPVGCPVYPNGGRELAEITETFLQRGFIVTTSGCAAMTLATNGDKLYERYDGAFDACNLVNVGSCVANSHIAGAAVKVASIFAKRKLDANFEEIADYILNRVGAVGIVWGAMSQKAMAIASGCNVLGIPVIFGPTGKKYRRDLRSDENTDWGVYDTRGSGKYNVGPVPEHLFYTAETKEEAILLAAKLVMRASDGSKGRQIKLAHYIDLSEKLYKKIPDDFHLFVRNEHDLPLTRKEELLKILNERGWKPVEKIPDPTLVARLSGGNAK